MTYKITEVLTDLYNQNSYLLDEDLLNENEIEYYKSIRPGMDDKVVSGAIRRMTYFLQRHYGKNVMIFLTVKEDMVFYARIAARNIVVGRRCCWKCAIPHGWESAVIVEVHVTRINLCQMWR